MVVQTFVKSTCVCYVEAAPLVCKADLIDSQPSRKVLHDDGQPPVDAEYVIPKLTVQDDVVFDPLMGAARAALRLKRRFIGSEKDKDTFALANATIDRELSYIGARQ
jgi:DNA modification methylase